MSGLWVLTLEWYLVGLLGCLLAPFSIETNIEMATESPSIQQHTSKGKLYILAAMNQRGCLGHLSGTWSTTDNFTQFGTLMYNHILHISSMESAPRQSATKVMFDTYNSMLATGFSTNNAQKKMID